MLHDLRYVLRSIARRKGYALVTVLTLALGIGSAAAIYSVAAWHLFRGPLVPPGVYSLAVHTRDAEDMNYIPFGFAQAYAADTAILSQAAFATGESQNVIVDREPVTTSVTGVSANYFDVLGVTPLMGRAFRPDECVRGRDTVAVVTYGFWKAHLGGLPGVLGARLRVGGQICTVVGVLREAQRLPVQGSAEVFRPLTPPEEPGQPFSLWVVAFVTLRPGVTPRQAEAGLGALKVEVSPDMQPFASSFRPAVHTVADAERFLHRERYWTLVGAVGFLYAIACLNATNLALVHLFSRRREISVRAALGGSRWGILRLVGLESMLLTLAGTLLGAGVANGMGPLFFAIAGNPDPQRGWLTWNLGGHVFWVLAGLSLATALLTSAAPGAFLLRMNLNSGLKAGAGALGESPGLARTRGAFVVLQAAFAVVLLVGAGLMIRTFQRLEHLRLGFEPAHRVKMHLMLPGSPSSIPDEKRAAQLEGLKGALLSAPGVAAAAYASDSLLSGYNSAWTSIKGNDGAAAKAALVYTSDDYIQAGGITLLSGRWFASDTKGDVVINETLARRWFAGSNPVGHFVRTEGTDGGAKGWQVVGVAADVREELRDGPLPTVYVPVRWSPGVVSTFLVDLKAQPDARALLSLRQTVYAWNPNVVIFSVTPLEKALVDLTYNERLTLSVLRVLSAVALALTLVGLFSVVAYTVDRRMGEFGIRMALGATPGALSWLVLRRSLALTLVGVALGVAGALALTRFIKALLFETAAFEWGVVGAVAALLLLSGVAACLLPARKAAKPDLATLLRQSE